MFVAFLVLAVLVVLGIGALHQAHIRRHLPHDLRKITTEGLPSEASIRSGELGLGTGSTVFRNWPGM
jgi:hypothetical protein